MRVLALGATALAACSLDVNYTGTYYQCGSGGTCPPGYECQSEICVPTTPVPPACSTAVMAGGDHGCAIRTDGTVWCWGRNDHGQVGDGTTIDRDEPTQVIGLANAVSVAGGDDFTCAIDGGGELWCWGHDDQGQLGDGATSDEHMPEKILSNVKQVALGAQHACAITSDGTASCWGNNDDGQLGNGGTNGTRTPGAVMGPPTTWSAIAAGGMSTCGIDSTGAVYCWGANTSGQLGVGDTNPRSSPAKITMLQATAIAIGGDDNGHGFACSATSAGAVYCWGDNSNGELGNGGGGNQSTPVAALTVEHMVTLSAGGGQMCGVDDHHRLWCWGYNGDSRLADGTTESRAIPVRSMLDPTRGFSTGGAATCTVDGTGAVYCAGTNIRGELGNGVQTSRGKPQPVPGLSNVNAIVAGGEHTCAVLADASVECWGANDRGQVGDGAWTDRTAPSFAATDSVATLVGGGAHTCEISMVGDAQCWGDDYSGQLGDGRTQTASPVPLLVYGINTKVDRIAAGDGSTCALVGGTVLCWGNVGGLMPTDIGGVMPTGYLGVATGNGHVCAIRADKQVRCVGTNNYGSLGAPCSNGNSSCGGDNDPVPSALVANVSDVQARGDATCVLTGAGDVVCWGYVGYQENTPPTMFMSGAVELAMGYDAICARKMDGSVWCFGDSAYVGQLGDGTYAGHRAPAQVLTGATGLASGGSHACALMSDKTVQCWGDDERGQLGDGIESVPGPQGTHMTCPK